MGKTYYDSTLTDAQIQQVLDAISNILSPSNNGKVLAISGGTLEARSVQWGGGYPEPTGTITLTENGLHNVKDYAEALVDVQGGSSIEVIPLSANANAVYTAPEGKAYSPVTVSVQGGNILSGRDAPSASLGNDGDIYKQVVPIPSNVDFVEYLESTGTQYIDTGIIPTANSSFIADFTNRASPTIVCGGRSSTGSPGTSSYHYGVQIANAANYNTMLIDFGTGGRTSGIPISYGRHIVVDGKVKKLDGSILAKRDYGGSYPIEDNVSIYLSARNSTVEGVIKEPSIIHRFLHLENGIVAHDYLPCLDGNGVACMWENVTQQYIYNSGTGVFSHGNTVNPDTFPVYFVKKNGAWEVIQQ